MSDETTTKPDEAAQAPAPSSMKMPPHPKAVAMITGASSGIGKALALKFGREGYDVAMLARRPGPLADAAAQVRDYGAEVWEFPVDITDRDAFAKVFDDLLAKTGGRLDVFVANAGIGPATPAKAFDLEAAQQTIDLNCSAFVQGIAMAMRPLRKIGRGHLVAISSLAAFRGIRKSAVYCASKALESAFMESLRLDLRGTDIHCLTVHPGYVDTPIHDEKTKKKLPHLVPAATAADLIYKGIETRANEVNFPAPLVAMARLGQMLPNALFDRFS
ncbi:MAG: SDR family NAD(P)-dependent oxidoreductase [Deltaproteobacteria bacterium]|nr:SDR family NAD(P)-dependent oxidoreductase [Deltaproteobacteria bacterium]MCB9489522.1 SDR family NAD(P)-dependent oxidoreductase [Deltaproteobacteria bacterium]